MNNKIIKIDSSDDVSSILIHLHHNTQENQLANCILDKLISSPISSHYNIHVTLENPMLLIFLEHQL